MVKLFWDEQLTRLFECRHCQKTRTGTRNQVVCLDCVCQKKEQRRMRTAQKRRKRLRAIAV